MLFKTNFCLNNISVIRVAFAITKTKQNGGVEGVKTVTVGKQDGCIDNTCTLRSDKISAASAARTWGSGFNSGRWENGDWFMIWFTGNVWLVWFRGLFWSSQAYDDLRLYYFDRSHAVGEARVLFFMVDFASSYIVMRVEGTNFKYIVHAFDDKVTHP